MVYLPKEYEDLYPAAKSNKYHAVKETSGGKKYDSGREAERGRELETQQRCEIISDLKEQPKKFMLQEGFRHKSWPIKIQAITPMCQWIVWR